jgi:NTE family protein
MNDQPKSIGLILSGGGSKGIAHAGVLQFLEEKKILPLQIAGSSAGAIVAALYGSGKSPESILEFFKSIYFFHWRHFTFSKAGLIDSESFKEYFYHIFKETTLSELKFPVHITATDMIKGKSKIFSPETKTIDAILASSSFPGIMSPYEIDGNLYSDGGILNHFPTDILKDKCDTLIGVYVSPIQKIKSRDLTSIKSVTARAFDLLSENSSIHKFDHCQWLIKPAALSQYSTFETSKINMEAIFNIGYESAKKSYRKLNLNI